MDRIYMICILTGFILPLLSLIFGSLMDIFDGITDAFDFGLDIEIGSMEICIIPISMQSICAGLLIFGTTGKVFGAKYDIVPVTAAGIILGYGAAVIIQSFMRRLRRVVNTTYSREELMSLDAKVVNTIQTGAYGSIRITTEDGISNTYPAKAEDVRDEIKAGIIVEVIRFEKHTAIVKVKNSAHTRIAQGEKKEELSDGRRIH